MRGKGGAGVLWFVYLAEERIGNGACELYGSDRYVGELRSDGWGKVSG